MNMFKHAITLAVLSFAISANAATPSEIAPQVPADAQSIIHVDVKGVTRLPMLKDAIEELNKDMNKDSVSIADFSEVTSFSGADVRVGAITLKTTLTVDRLTEIIKSEKKLADTAITPITIKGIKGVKVAFPAQKDAMLGMFAMPFYPLIKPYEKGEICILQVTPGSLMLGSAEGLEWAIKPAKTIDMKSEMMSAIPAKNANQFLVWGAFSPTMELDLALELEKQLSMLQIPIKELNVFGGGFHMQDTEYIFQFKAGMTTDTAAQSMQNGLSMLIAMAGMGGQQNNALASVLNKIQIRAAKKNVGITVRFDDSFIEAMQNQTRSAYNRTPTAKDDK